jgi:hypothetical protein
MMLPRFFMVGMVKADLSPKLVEIAASYGI